MKCKLFSLLFLSCYLLACTPGNQKFKRHQKNIIANQMDFKDIQYKDVLGLRIGIPTIFEDNGYSSIQFLDQNGVTFNAEGLSCEFSIDKFSEEEAYTIMRTYFDTLQDPSLALHQHILKMRLKNLSTYTISELENLRSKTNKTGWLQVINTQYYEPNTIYMLVTMHHKNSFYFIQYEGVEVNFNYFYDDFIHQINTIR